MVSSAITSTGRRTVAPVECVDSHLHVWDPKAFAYPWLDQTPALNRAYGLQEYHEQAQPLGCGHSVLVEADVAVADQAAEARFLCALADDPNNHVMAVVAAGWPESEGFAEHLQRIAHPRLVGIRRVLHVVDDGISRDARFRKHVALLADANLSFDLCVRADQLPLAIELVGAAPATQFVLDHGGNPPLNRPAALAAWREHMQALCEYDNVVCKLSGLVNHLPADAQPLTSLQPIVDHLLGCFGWQRLLFGSDWPVCTLAQVDVAGWLAMARQLTAKLDESATQAVFTTNALRVYQQDKTRV